jgi:hypothetical protein
MFDFFNRSKKKNNSMIKPKYVSSEKQSIDITFNDLVVKPSREPNEYSTTGYKYAHTRTTSFRGEGFEAKDFAKKLGIVYMSSDNPNSKLINKVIDSLRPKPKPTGIKEYDIYTYNNGGHGHRTNENYLYEESLADGIRNELMRNSEKINQNEYVYKGVKYRVL